MLSTSEHVERLFGQQPLRLPGARGFDDGVPGVAQRAAERLENLLLVVDEQQGAAMEDGHAVRAGLGGLP